MQFAPMRRFKSVFLAAALAAALPGPAPAQGLSLAEAQRTATERSRELAAQSSMVTASREMAVAAGRLPDPVLSLGIENVPLEGPDRFSLTREGMTMQRIGIMQMLERGEKRELKSQKFELEAQKGLVEQEATRAMIRRDTAMAWLDTWYAEQAAKLLAEIRVRGLQEVQAADAEYRAGKGMQADVLMSRASIAMLDDRAAEVELKVKKARTMLGRWVGEKADEPLGDRPDINVLDARAHGEEAIATHPEIEVLERQEAIAQSEAKLARAERQPDWSVELAYQRRASQFGDMVSIMASVPLPWDRANRQDRELAAKLAMADQARYMREEALRKHAAEVRAMVQEWEVNRQRLVRFDREIVPLAVARADAALAAYRAGKSNVSEVLAARRAEIDTRLQALQVEAEAARMWAQINFLIGEKKQ